jgi:hypothetical protein
MSRSRIITLVAAALLAGMVAVAAARVGGRSDPTSAAQSADERTAEDAADPTRRASKAPAEPVDWRNRAYTTECNGRSPRPRLAVRMRDGAATVRLSGGAPGYQVRRRGQGDRDR